MIDTADLITPEIAAQVLAEYPPIRLELTLPEADLLVAVLAGAGTLSSAVLGEKVRRQALPQAAAICEQAAILHAPAASDSAN